MDHSKEQMRDMKVWGFLGNELQVSTVKKGAQETSSSISRARL